MTKPLYLTDRSRLHKKANEALGANLATGERLEVIITGHNNQAVIGTNRRAFVYKKGFMAGATFGSELTSWDYRNITGVQLHTGIMNGAVVLQAPGQSGTKTSYWGQGNDDAFKAPNAIPISRPYDLAAAGVARLRELIDAVHHPVAPPAHGSASRRSPEDPWELLRKLGDLRDSGVLTAEDFDAKKAEILKRI